METGLLDGVFYFTSKCPNNYIILWYKLI